MSRGKRIAAAILAAIGAWCAVAMADLGALTELGASGVADVLVSFAYLAGLALVAAALLFAFGRRFARAATASGAVLGAPWALWLLFPGLACRIMRCPGDYPDFAFNPVALGMIALPLTALALARR